VGARQVIGESGRASRPLVTTYRPSLRRGSIRASAPPGTAAGGAVNWLPRDPADPAATRRHSHSRAATGRATSCPSWTSQRFPCFRTNGYAAGVFYSMRDQTLGAADPDPGAPRALRRRGRGTSEHWRSHPFGDEAHCAH